MKTTRAVARALTGGLSVGLGIIVFACSASDAPESAKVNDPPAAGAGGSAGAPATTTGGSGGGLNVDAGWDGPFCARHCSTDLRSVIDCKGAVESCSGTERCDTTSAACVDACKVAVDTRQSVGCEYYATYMDTTINPFAPYQQCFAAFVANTWNTHAHLSVDFGAGAVLPIEEFTRIPDGSGPTLQYKPYDPKVGLAPSQVAILFLSGPTGSPGASGKAPCPVPSAVPSGAMMAAKSGIGSTFRIQSDVPVVAYQMNPYGGGSAAVTGASLLLPTSAWDKNYVAVNAYDYSGDVGLFPSLNIVAAEDDTKVTLVPVAAVTGGGGIPAGAANAPLEILLQRGQHAQISQAAVLTGSVLQADKPIGFMAGHNCMKVPQGTLYCDHGEQMIPPVRALGSEYVGVMARPRVDEPAIWRVIGAVDGTVLSWSSDVGGPAKLDRGQVAEFIGSTPFVVKSQDDDHPFMLFTYMSGSLWKPGLEGYGDADFVMNVPAKQYMDRYVFFTDPTYPETNLVVVRSKKDGKFADVKLDCAGTLTGWTALGEYEWTRADLATGNFQAVGNCSTGRREMTSDAQFGVMVWGWGSPLTGDELSGVFTKNVSYAYPAGMNVKLINQVVVPAVPR